MKHNYKYFYSHLIEIDSIIIELDRMDLSEVEKLHLSKLIDSSIHHAILDAVFSELSNPDKRAFVNHLNEGDSEIIWNFLKDKIDDIEEKIRKTANELKLELHKDLKEATKREND